MQTETLIRILAAALVVGAFTVSGYYRRKAEKADKAVDYTAENPWLLRIRSIGAIIFYLGLLTYLAYPLLLAWAVIAGWPIALRWVGVGLMLLNLPLLVWMFRSLGKNITPTVKTRGEHELVVVGPYRYIRHPLYTFGGVFFFGAILVAGNWLLLISGVVALWALGQRTPLEEEMLTKKFGQQYKDYMAKTGRYLPKLG